MDAVPIVGREDEAFKQFLSQYDAPAYVRRARQVQAVFEDLLARCRRQRDEWLQMARLRLGMLRALAGVWETLQPLLANEDQLRILRELEAALAPHLRVPVEPATSSRALKQALAELCDSLERFNRRWTAYLAEVDVSEVNKLREGYNRFYLLEKECAVRNARVARQGYQPLPPLTVAELSTFLPPLPVPR
jgi:HAMP domain-containing protein